MTTCYADAAGLRHDRRWMLIDDQSQFVSQRSYAQMALFSLAQHGDYFQVSFGGDCIQFHIEERTGTPFESGIWDDKAWSVEVNPVISQWFSEKLGKNVRLVKMVHEEARLHHSSILDTEIPVSLADAYPYLIAGTESLHLLNEKLTNPVSMNRFRPNLVISTGKAHEEDDWGTYTIGEAQFRSLKPCGRCQVVTIDQQTGQTHPEPLTVLNTYRRENNSVMFGAHAVCIQEGHVSIGDRVTFL